MAASPIDDVLRERFGLEAFRPWQREAIDAVLGEPGRALVVAPTGGGKSLTYQLPAAVLGAEGLTLVVSPLVALMEDQVRSLTARGIQATYLASTVDMAERRAREDAMLRGDYELVYVAPERLANGPFLDRLTRCKLALVAIDEAHCIAQWGHDFRPEYLQIGALLERLRPPRVLACTATATPAVRREILERLGLEERCKEVLRGFARPNLHLAAQHVEGPREAKAALERELDKALGDRRMPRGGAIVYAATRKTTEQYADMLAKKGWSAAAYHAGMSGDERSKVAARFASRKLHVVVATNAFGMGIDRADIRAVVHVQPPSSIEAYYQEVGRAGRDGDEASGLLLCSNQDIGLRRRLVTSGGDGEVDPALAARAWDLFRDLLRYLDARSCRHDFVLRYFGDENETLGGCGHCDVCLELDGEAAIDDAPNEETTLLVKKALSAVARAQRRGGMLAIADMLRGATTAKTENMGFTKLSTFGLMKDRSHEWIVAFLRSLLAAGWIDLTPSEHPVPYLTKAGTAVMMGQTPARIGLPAEPRAPSSRRRGRAERGASSSSSSPKPKVELALDDVTKALFERLRARRAEIARESKLPAYVICHDRTLADMAHKKPLTRAALLEVHGMGPARIESYGERFLDVLTSG
ncbi:MAG: ATP-dependent DNA helicase RecQ [Labilithrix sp.]|nr:ATP-dependent DNA helicase RecQ [Labilithrix sp.]MCW5813458.1 ATP-dependent DNA helicase RecQ [Labilithrix sp.]